MHVIVRLNLNGEGHQCRYVTVAGTCSWCNVCAACVISHSPAREAKTVGGGLTVSARHVSKVPDLLNTWCYRAKQVLSEEAPAQCVKVQTVFY